MLTFSVPFLINFISAILMVAMGFFILHRNHKDRVNQAFTLITIFGAFWISSSALSDAIHDIALARTVGNIAIIGPFLSFGTMYIFARIFPYARTPLSSLEKTFLIIPFVVSLPFVFTVYNIRSVSIETWGMNFVPGPLYILLLGYALVALVLSWWELREKSHATKDAQTRAQITFLLIAFGLLGGLGLLTNLILPLFGWARASAIGPSSALFFVIFTSYAIVKHHLLDVKVVATEFFGAMLSLISFVQIFGTQTTFGYIIRISGFLLISFFTVLFVRSVLKEVEQRQQLQKLAKQLRIKNTQLKKLDDFKSTMVSIASHQLRGPLGGMRGYLTMFRDGDLGPLTDKQRDIVKMNISTLSRLLNSVETFLDITKIEAGKMLLRKEVLPLDDAVRDVAHELEIMVRKKGLELETDIEEHVWVSFDPEKIKHVVFNLIDNAMKYTDAGKITVTLHKENGEAVVRVSDTGKGIPEKDIPKLFGKFVRGGLVVDRGGSGLGLYIVKMLTEMQGGHVDVSSEGTGKGATFQVCLPLAREHH